ncbi:MAG TPA: hypothetical protein VEX86_16130 [Longimicrobium sp.]|nr:hypothetical protein [Longimicrobium sp.]
MSGAAPGGARPEPALNGYSLEWVEPGLVLASARDRLFRAPGADGPFEEVARFPTPLALRVAARLRMAQRVLRFMYYNALRLPDDRFFLSFGRDVGVLREGKVERLKGLLRPARVMRGACALDAAAGAVYFGEYLNNPGRTPILVYRYRLGEARLEVAHVFQPGAVRHVHGIYHDPYTGGLWCTTGDRGAENQILFTPDGFRTLEVAGGGDESWRCISLQFTADAVYYGTDAEFIPNHLYRLDRRTGLRERITALEGPTYYSCSHRSSCYFGVAAELCPSQTGRFAALWRVGPDGTAARVLTVQKDRLDPHYFMPGTLDFPRGPGLADRLLFHVTSLAPDNRCFSVPVPVADTGRGALAGAADTREGFS